MTLTAPSHLRGPIRRSDPRWGERLAWIIQHNDARHRQSDMAAALGIRQASLSLIMTKAGIHKPHAAPRARAMCRHGLRLGRMVEMFDALPVDLRSDLAREAADLRGTIADAIAARLAPPKTGSGAANG
ncbi:hypothetical protein [Paracoccus versutus]|uniref:Uncharacterized protein n=1 Tax=Paracoccus versutus TaxID=34007 RepID=A0A3D9XTC8_PARVE|nr:hypothetical protein [Paracoccus versutus]REF72373.1 hypothetical protein BDD41_0843 [Paracoccus versutus]WGR55650.1 hypothetical protein E3U25_06630 [Paracoccus versutus]